MLSLSRKLGSVSNSSGPGKPGPTNVGRRNYSTSAFGQRRATSDVPAPSKGLKRSPSLISGVTRKLKAISPLLKVGKISDNFFRVIAKKGSLVSLLGGKASKGRPTLANLFSKVGFRIFGAVFTNSGKYLSRLRQLNAFRVHIDIKRRHHGHVFVVKYLKVSQLAVQKAIAGTPVSSLRELDPAVPLARTCGGGLPKWIPLRDRRLIIVNGSPSVIR